MDCGGKVWVMLLGFVSGDASLLRLMDDKGMGATMDDGCEFVLRLGLLKFSLGLLFCCWP